MSPSFLIVFLIICINHSLVIGEDPLQLKLVAIVHRHGDRAPLNFLPGDPYSDDIFWPDGKSQLLASGKDRLYQLGESLRLYYDNFLTNNPREVRARSSDADRCIESAEMLFHGLYKAKGRWIYNSKTDYLPIPIHTTPTMYDRMLAEGVYCPVLNKETQAVFERPESKSFLTKYSTTLAVLTQNLGLKFNDLGLVFGIFDAWMIEKSQNYKLPSWMTESIWNDLIEMVNLYSTIQNDSPIIHRLRAGNFLADLKKYFIQSTEPSNGKQPVKLITYSTHDTMLGSFMSTLKIFNKIRVPYGAALLIELLASPDNKQNYVQIKYWNDTYVNEQHKLTLPFCESGQLCKLDQFLDYIDQFIPTVWESECSLNNTESGPSAEDNKRFDDQENDKGWEWVGIVAATCLSIITVIIVMLFASFAYDLYKKSYRVKRSDREKQEYDRIL